MPGRNRRTRRCTPCTTQRVRAAQKTQLGEPRLIPPHLLESVQLVRAQLAFRRWRTRVLSLPPRPPPLLRAPRLCLLPLPRLRLSRLPRPSSPESLLPHFVLRRPAAGITCSLIGVSAVIANTVKAGTLIRIEQRGAVKAFLVAATALLTLAFNPPLSPLLFLLAKTPRLRSHSLVSRALDTTALAVVNPPSLFEII